MSFPEVQPYPPEVKSLLTFEGFENAFWQLYNSENWKSREACYEALEGHYEYFYGNRRFEDYNSFRNCISYHYKKLKNAKR